ncbi:3-methyl-2-oxobutanoate hydroxymethyltransferase [Pelotomaculum terephthalicicum JT]|uniref:3-methyl-2-oxobutanoate hydroxymethyltransferase n=1 Tax=Pelotomaculum TaxID=191373 RepID=UPI0009C9E350|nr:MULTISPECIES: 3-methyl-2-oxobutanoate hydroxymethyltransferase [Pelotomaculum]MCG9968289.1 3-methyl-2-oxobutanoate hydroxymethyltransferase [Pelotomaculum terephthalicicum JT]OPX89506.1 MAG: 3-methyl-2-oxobutanoate hydroxymethyltransferase [Pelotomaculum sp. PtaB.Bin117]OPY63263.1 MAG: 3-methyl-2-oxobutanoate hydroxymethyltransferase [Pelotomaculum sp. PtaU1.Bin065]
MKQEKITTAIVKQKKAEGRPITVLTAYDFPMAKIVDEAGIDIILVGDSMGNVVLGYDSTIPVTMDDMVHHVKAVCRGARRAMIVADMPFLSYQASEEEAVRNAGRFLKEAGAQAVKLEGGAEVVGVVRKIVNAGIPVMGHLGLTPQSINQLGGFKVQGKDERVAKKMIADAKALEEAGVFSVVLECVPAPLAKLITESIGVATIGIGASPYCDGQVLVIHDILGLYPGFTPKFVKQYANLHEQAAAAVKQYKEEVEARAFPAPEHCFGMSEEVLEKLY